MLDEFVDERQGGNEHAAGECERLFPIVFQKFSVGCHATDRHNEKNEWRDAEGDIRMKSKAEDETGDEKGKETFGAETAKEEKERERENERHHDGAETDS